MSRIYRDLSDHDDEDEPREPVQGVRVTLRSGSDATFARCHVKEAVDGSLIVLAENLYVMHVYKAGEWKEYQAGVDVMPIKAAVA